METTLHRQLKALYAADPDEQEVNVDGYRIDAVDRGRLIEIQYGSLGAIRKKVKALLRSHDVHVVKPLAARKYLVKRNRAKGKIISARYSPLRAGRYHLFDDLVHFIDVFPHPRLTLEVIFTEQEEHRVAKRGSRWKRRDFRVVDRLLRSIEGRLVLRTRNDLLSLLPDDLPKLFSTADIAAQAKITRGLAQKMAYCLRKSGAIRNVSKRGNTLLYRVSNRRRKAA